VGAESNHTDLHGYRRASLKSLEVSSLRHLLHSQTDLKSLKDFANN